MGAITKIAPGVYRLDARAYVDCKELRKRAEFRGSLAEAKDQLTRIRDELKSRDGGCSLKTLFTVKDILDQYAARRQYSPAHRATIDQLIRDLGEVKIHEVPDRLDGYLVNLQTTPSPKTGKLRGPHCTNRVVQALRAAFGLAVAKRQIAQNPITQAQFPKLREDPRDRSLGDSERLRLLNTVDREAPHLGPAVRFLLQVPTRKGELVRMRREDLDLLNGCIRVRSGSTKNKVGLDKPIPPDMLEYFRTLPNDTEYLFFRRDRDGVARHLGDFKRAWARCKRLAGIENFHVHDTRHIAATSLSDNGTPERIIMQVAGWTTNMLATYYHRNPKSALKLVCFDRETVLRPDSQVARMG